jgi:RHS repeat-associated protein
LYDVDDVVLDKDGANNKVDYLNGLGIDDKLRQPNSSVGSLYFLQDHLNSTIALTGTNGDVAERLNYESFGESVNSSLTRFTYTGRENDSITGLMYYRARWYDQKQGRFSSEDPIGFRSSLNLYEYVENNPMAFKDPMGLEAMVTCYKGDSVNYSSPVDEAAKAAIIAINPMTQRLKTEFCGIICVDCSNGCVFYTPPTNIYPDPNILDRLWTEYIGGTLEGKHNRCRSGTRCPTGSQPIGTYHTHPKSEDFSKLDRLISEQRAIPSYVGTPSGSVQKYTPTGNKANPQGREKILCSSCAK